MKRDSKGRFVSGKKRRPARKPYRSSKRKPRKRHRMVYMGRNYYGQRVWNMTSKPKRRLNKRWARDGWHRIPHYADVKCSTRGCRRTSALHGMRYKVVRGKKVFACSKHRRRRS
jgi:hypothetical protein